MVELSGLRFWEHFSEVLLEMGFKPSKAEDDIWMKDMESHYEYIARYVDDLAIISKCPQNIIKTFTEKYNFNLKDQDQSPIIWAVTFSETHITFCAYQLKSTLLE